MTDIITTASRTLRRLHKLAVAEGNADIAQIVYVALAGMKAIELRRARDEIDRKLAEMEVGR